MQALSKLVYVVTTEVEPEWEDEFNRWYDQEHLPALMSVPGYLSGRRYVAVEGAPKYMAFWEIESLEAYRSPEHDRAANTPWSERLRPHRKAQLAFFRQVLGMMNEQGFAYVVSGAFALQEHTGIFRDTKDLDLFCTPATATKALAYLKGIGFQTEVTDPIWLAKAWQGGFFVDFITGMSNGVIAVDEAVGNTIGFTAPSPFAGTVGTRYILQGWTRASDGAAVTSPPPPGRRRARTRAPAPPAARAGRSGQRCSCRR